MDRHASNYSSSDSSKEYSKESGNFAGKSFGLSGLIIGLALGALAMYAMDPRQGRRRRHEARDKLYSASLKTRKTINAKSRHFANRAKGIQAKASHLLH